MLQSLFVCRRLLTGGTVIPVSLIAVVPTVFEKSVFLRISRCSICFPWAPTQFVHCCLAATRAFMPASLIVIPYTILEISKFLGQLPVDDDDDEKCQLVENLFTQVGIRKSRAATNYVRVSILTRSCS